MKKKLKRQQYITKQTAYYAGAFALGGIVFVAITWFLGNYRLQSPVIFQSPFVSRYISPLPDSKTAKPVVTPLNGSEDKAKEKVEETKASPSPTPRPKRTLVPVVEAAEINPSDREIAKYIASKDWDYSTAIRIAKSENAWNYTQSFDCTRRGGQNSNGTYDHGLWQINDIHIKSGAISLEDAYDCYKSTDFAYGLYKGRGNWSAWYAYTNGSYLNHSVIEL